jgi:hypothetical protein
LRNLLIQLRSCPPWSRGISAGLGGKSSFPQRRLEVVEVILVLFQQTPEIHQGRLLMGVLAAGVWSNLAFAFKMWRVKRARKIGES